MLAARSNKKLFESAAFNPPPYAPVEPVVERLHGVEVVDPYRWLEDQNSPRTRTWLEEQDQYARAYLDSIPSRDHIRARVRELLSVETFDSLVKVGSRFFFRKRSPAQEQPCIYVRYGPEGEDQLLVDPLGRGTGTYTAVEILQTSRDGRLLAYAVKQGGESSHTVEILDVEKRESLPDGLPRGILHGFAFAPDNLSFYYVHRALGAKQPFSCAVYRHAMGSDSREDELVFFAGEDPSLRLGVCAEGDRLGFVVLKLSDPVVTEFHLLDLRQTKSASLVFRIRGHLVTPILVPGKVLILTDMNAPNMQILELQPSSPEEPLWSVFTPEADCRPTSLAMAMGADRMFLAYLRGFSTRVDVWDLAGNKVRELAFPEGQTIRLLKNHPSSDELLYESESFTQAPAIYRYKPTEDRHVLWSERQYRGDSKAFSCERHHYRSKDGTLIPILLVGRKSVLRQKSKPVLLTAYGGFGTSMTPRFSFFVAFMLENGCAFALASVRGGGELGARWHLLGKRLNRQRVNEDFISAAEWLIEREHTSSQKLAIFGGSNSGLLVGVALTQRPELFRAAVCLAPLLDMLRYHEFDFAADWISEYGMAENADDFSVLYAYSPYHQVRKGVAYPATLLVTGDADGICNSLHARKMIACLQAANGSDRPIILDYNALRGHSPVLPLSERINALTNRLAFLCRELDIAI